MGTRRLSLFLPPLVCQSLDCPDKPPKKVEDETDDRHRPDDPDKGDYCQHPPVIREHVLLSHRLLLPTAAPGRPEMGPRGLPEAGPIQAKVITSLQSL
jgi:hypothetical protein